MSLDIQPRETRSYLPFRIELNEGHSEKDPSVLVRPEGKPKTDSFRLPLKWDPKNGKYSAMLTLKTPGRYEVVYDAGGTKMAETVTVAPQVFLDFKSEFGFFTLLFVLVMTIMVLWVRRIMKKARLGSSER